MRIIPGVDDSPVLLDRVHALTVGLLRAYVVPSLILIKVDNFFSARWLRFSGKALGALGIWKKQLTIPPFVPNRIVSQQCFVGRDYDELVPSKPIHISTPSIKALQRHTAEVAGGALVVWYSGGSTKSGQVAMMAHIPTPEDYLPIYVRWVEQGSSWKIRETLEINSTDVERLSQDQIAPKSTAVASGVPRA